jgi:hypothetical protein
MVDIAILLSLLINISIFPFIMRFTFDSVGKDKEIKKVTYLEIGHNCDSWRDVMLSSPTKLLPIPSGYAHGTMQGPMNARLALLWLSSHTGNILGA